MLLVHRNKLIFYVLIPCFYIYIVFMCSVVLFSRLYSWSLHNWPLGCKVCTYINKNWIELNRPIEKCIVSDLASAIVAYFADDCEHYWDVMTCRFECLYQCFASTLNREPTSSSETLARIELNVVTSHKTVIFMLWRMAKYFALLWIFAIWILN
jgi:hypothetical protein